VITVEDPIEYTLPLATQVQANSKIGWSPAACLQSVMNLDPDIIMVGELSDGELLRGCCQAALTGHLVLTQMHADDAVSVLIRLREWGIEPFLLTSAITGISAQRLVRVLCPECKSQASVPPGGMDRLRKLAAAGGYVLPEEAVFMHPVGCDKCHGGYRRRTGLYELIELSDELSEAFLKGADYDELLAVALRNGMRTMAAYGARLAAEGKTSVEEVLRVLC